MARQPGPEHPSPDPSPPTRKPEPATGAEAVQTMAHDLAETFDVTAEVASDCLNRLVDTFARELLDRPDELAVALRRFPLRLFTDALHSLPPPQAVSLVMGPDLTDLVRRVRTTEYLLEDSTPLHTVAELAGAAREFVAFLQADREHIIRTGLLSRTFDQCPWLHLHLGRLYDTRTTGRSVPRPDRGPAVYPPYTWVRYLRPTAVSGHKLVACPYEDADLVKGLEASDDERVGRDRPLLFDVKLRVLRHLARAASRGDGSGLWDSCLAVLTEALNAEQVEFYFRLDRIYLGSDARRGLEGGIDPHATPGGLTNLLEVVGHYEAELTHRMLDQARQSVPSAYIDGAASEGTTASCRYLAAVNRPDRPDLDAALDRVMPLAGPVLAFWEDYRDRLQEALRGQFRVLVEIEMYPRHVETLRPLVQDYANQVQAKRDRGELAVPLVDRSVFRRHGNSWTIHYDGVLIAKPHSEGLGYIAQILRNPGKELQCLDLRALKARWEAGPGGARRAEQVNLVGPGGPADDAPDALRPLGRGTDDGLDREGRTALESACRSLPKQIKEAEDGGDHARAARLREELDRIKEDLARDSGPGGRHRRQDKAVKNANDAVRKAIDRALLDLREAHPQLHRHLSPSLGNGPPYRYDPHPVVDWDL